MIVWALAAVPAVLAGGPAAPTQEPALLNDKAVVDGFIGAIPDEVVKRGGHGILTVDVHVSEAGQPIACDVTETSGEPGVDAAFCGRLLKKGRFAPAHDRSGIAVPGDFRMVSGWAIGGGPTPVTEITIPLIVVQVPEDYRSPVKTITTFDGTGHAITCRVTDPSGSAAADAGACAFLKAQLAITPPKSASPAIPPLAVRSVTVSMEADRRGAAAGK